MSDFNNKPPRETTILNSSKLRLSAPCPTARGTFSHLSWDLYNGNPRLVHNTNDPNLKSKDTQWGKIEAAMDPVIFNQLLQVIKKVAETPGESKWPVEIHGQPYINGQRSENIVHTATIFIGRNKEGSVYMSLTSPDTRFPKTLFVFGPSDARWVKFKHHDNTDWTLAELSTNAALAYVEMLSQMVNALMVTKYVPPPPRTGPPGNKGNYGGGGGGNRNYGNSAPAAAAPAEADDDMPF